MKKLKRLFKWSDDSDRKLKKSRNAVRNENIAQHIKRYCYRPFDLRWIYYSDSVVSRTRKEVAKHMFQDNLALITNRLIYSQTESKGAFVSDKISDEHTFSGKCYFFPLYLYSDKSKEKNFTDEFLQAIHEALGVEPAPEEIFYYIYAVLYALTYRKRYEEFLKIDFPRVPLPEDYEKFKKLSELGKELVELHLLKHPSLSETGVGFPVGGSNVVEKVRYDGKRKRVYFNKRQYFDGISREVWEYKIGAYQVMEKYLKDRKKRELSLEEIEHYMKVAKAIERTIEVQRKIE